MNILRYLILLVASCSVLTLGCEDKKEGDGGGAATSGGAATGAATTGGTAEAPKGDATAEAPKEDEKPKGPMFTTKGPMGEASLPIVPFDLSAAGLPGYTIQAPEGTKAETKSPSGHKLINLQVNYSITVSEGAFDKKATLEVYKILDDKGTIVEESDTHVIYKRSGDKGSHLFAAGVKVGDKDFKCSTVAGIRPFTKDQVDQSIASCKSIAAAAGGAAPAPGGDKDGGGSGATSPPAEEKKDK